MPLGHAAHATRERPLSRIMKRMILFKQYLQDKTETGYYSAITQVNNILGVG
jgi:hypothetical protein